MMMLKRIPKKSELFEAILAMIQEREDAAAKLELELVKLYDNFFERAIAAIASDESISRTDAINLQSSIAMIDRLNGILVAAGYEDVIAEYLDAFPVVQQAALDYFKPFGLQPSMAGIETANFIAWQKFTTTELAQQINRDLVSPIQSALLQVTLGNQSRQELVHQVMERSNLASTAQATQLVNEAFSQYQRGVLVAKGDQVGASVYHYIGPDDKKTSVQCQAMLKIRPHGAEGFLYKDEITIPQIVKLAKEAGFEIEGKLRYDPLTVGGHPNCRHHWGPVSERYAKGFGFTPRNEPDKQQQPEAA